MSDRDRIIAMLKDPKWIGESNRAIAAHLGVNHLLVATVRVQSG